MHECSFATLDDVLEHCASGGGTIAGGPLARLAALSAGRAHSKTRLSAAVS
jgi:hypothetical protein